MASIWLPKNRKTYMMKYYGQNGEPVRESTGETDRRLAKKVADAKETDKGRGLPVAAGVGKIEFGTLSVEADPAKGIGARVATGAVALFETDYRNNEQTSLDDQQRRLRLHLIPMFAGWRMAKIGPLQISAYIDQRRAEGASVGTVNRETDIIRRMFTLCVEQGVLLYQPHVPRLRERNARSGFFEAAQFRSVRAHLPEALQPVITFAYITGWRIDSEVLPLEWRQVDLDDANEVRLGPQQTKNGEPRVFRLTDDLRALLLERRAAQNAALAAGYVCPWVFFRLRGAARPKPQARACLACQAPLVNPTRNQRTCDETCGTAWRQAADRTRREARTARERRGIHRAPPRPHRPVLAPAAGRPTPIRKYIKAWQAACQAAGLAGKIPHDFRRTAVRNMVRRGVPERVAMQMAGHLTREVFERYNIVSEGDLAAAAGKLEGLAPAEATGTQTGTQTAEPAAAASQTRKKVRKFGGAARI